MKSNLPSTANRRASKLNVASFVMLLIYLFFSFVSNEFLLPERVHSLAMWAFLACVGTEVARKMLKSEQAGKLLKQQHGKTTVSVIEYKTVRVKFTGKFSVSEYTKWYFVFLLWSAASLAWTRFTAADTLYFMFISLILTYCFIHVLDSVNRLEWCAKTYALGGSVAALMLLATGQVFNLDGERLGQGEHTNANSFAITLMVAAIFAAWFAVIKSRGTKLFYTACFALILLPMGMSGGRKFIIADALCLCFFIFTKRKSSLGKIFSATLKMFAVLCALCWVVMNVPALYEVIGVRFESMLRMANGEGGDVNSDYVRVQMIELAFNRWLESPIWGHGIDSFKYYNRETTGYFFYSHNNYVELLHNVGIIGFSIYYYFVVKVIFKLYRTRNKNRPYKILGLGIIAAILFVDVGGMSYSASWSQFMLAYAYCCDNVTAAEEEGIRRYNFSNPQRLGNKRRTIPLGGVLKKK